MSHMRYLLQAMGLLSATRTPPKIPGTDIDFDTDEFGNPKPTKVTQNIKVKVPAEKLAQIAAIREDRRARRIYHAMKRKENVSEEAMEWLKRYVEERTQ